jgi:hypothetical protein
MSINHDGLPTRDATIIGPRAEGRGPRAEGKLPNTAKICAAIARKAIQRCCLAETAARLNPQRQVG